MEPEQKEQRRPRRTRVRLDNLLSLYYSSLHRALWISLDFRKDKYWYYAGGLQLLEVGRKLNISHNFGQISHEGVIFRSYFSMHVQLVHFLTPEEFHENYAEEGSDLSESKFCKLLKVVKLCDIFQWPIFHVIRFIHMFSVARAA